MPRIYRSTIIDAPIDAVWAVLRDFNDHDQWHPAVADSHIEDARGQDEIGAVRNFHLATGAQLREQLLSLSDREHSFTYCILDSPIPLIGYVASVKLSRVTDGNRTFWEWRSSFSTPPGMEATLEKMVAEGVYEAGFEAIRARVGRTSGARTTAGTQGIRPAGSANERAGAIRPAASMRAHAIVLDAHGGPEVMQWRQVDVQPPGPGEVRLRHTAIGVNYIDVYVRTGLYPLLTPPGTPGMEAAGVVIDAGAGVTGILPGDRVAYACPPVGAYTQLRTMKADQLVVLPDAIDDETAAALMLKGLSAEYLLHQVAHVKSGDIVLVHAAAGGVGLLMCQWARQLGATVLGTVSNTEKARLARAHGCDYPVIYTATDFVAQVREITAGHGADVVYDGVGKDTLTRSLEALAMRGHLVSYGQASGMPEPPDLGALAAKSATFSRPVLFHYTADPAALRAMAARVFDLVERGMLRVPVHQRYPLAEAARAHRELESRATTGASVLLP